MIHRQLILMILPAFLLFANVLSAQDQNYWIQLESFRQLSDSERYVEQVSRLIPRLHIFNSFRGRYLVVTGMYSKQEAADLRAQLISQGAIDEYSSISVGRHFRDKVWPLEIMEQDVVTTATVDNTPTTTLSVAPKENVLAAQAALKWFGDYSGRVDGLFGPRTASAIRSFQRRTGASATGRLTESFLRELTDSYNLEIDTIGFEPFVSTVAGISIEIPTNMLEYSRIDQPFVYFDPKPNQNLRLYLVSVSGDVIGFEALYKAFQEISFIPSGGTGAIVGDRFEIRAYSQVNNAYADVRLFDNRIKGFLLIWHAEETELIERVLVAMSESLQETSELTLAIPIENPSLREQSQLVDLDIPRPKQRISGFFIDSVGTVATSAVVADQCERILLGSGAQVESIAVDQDNGIAIIFPDDREIPIAHAKIQPNAVSYGTQLKVAGYSFGGELGSPTLTDAVWNGPDPRPGFENRALVSAELLSGDVGGPILDSKGAVVGILIADASHHRNLPARIHPVASAASLQQVASTVGKSIQLSRSEQEIDYIDMNQLAEDITVLVECY